MDFHIAEHSIYNKCRILDLGMSLGFKSDTEAKQWFNDCFAYFKQIISKKGQN